MARKRYLFAVLALAILFAISAQVPYAAGLPAPGLKTKNGRAPGGGITGSSHDFTHLVRNVAPVSLCLFCHTPHRNSAKATLLWNHQLSTQNFYWDVPSTTAGTIYPVINGQTYQGPSAKCLSCHDGTVAVGAVWVDMTGTRSMTPINATYLGGAQQIVAPHGSMAGNHPVAMPYPYQQTRNSYNGITSGEYITPNDWQSTPVAPVRLYQDDGKGNIMAGPASSRSGIECSSCHDPHNDITVGEPLLLGTLSGNDTDYLCLKCHMK